MQTVIIPSSDYAAMTYLFKPLFRTRLSMHHFRPPPLPVIVILFDIPSALITHCVLTKCSIFIQFSQLIDIVMTYLTRLIPYLLYTIYNYHMHIIITIQTAVYCFSLLLFFFFHIICFFWSDVNCLHYYFFVYVISYHNLVPAGEGLYRQCLLPYPIM